MKSTYYRVLDPGTGTELDFLGTDDCSPYEPNERCGGCSRCLIMQAEHAGCNIEKVELEVWLVWMGDYWANDAKRIKVTQNICEQLMRGGARVYVLCTAGWSPRFGIWLRFWGGANIPKPFSALHGAVMCVAANEHHYSIIGQVVKEFKLEELIIVLPTTYCKWDMKLRPPRDSFDGEYEISCKRKEPHRCYFGIDEDISRAVISGAYASGEYNYIKDVCPQCRSIGADIGNDRYMCTSEQCTMKWGPG